MSKRYLCSTFALTIAFSLGPVHDRLARGYTPESQEVKAMVDKGVAFIEKNFGKDDSDKYLGGVCICALACYAQSGDDRHPLVQKALAQLRSEAQKGFANDGHANYSLGIALIMLGDLDPVLYRKEVEAILSEVYKRQQPGGAWSYPSFQTGDTSQTQFAGLGMWMAHRQGIQVRQDVVERLGNWLIRTQAPDGAFGYQGKDPGSFTRIPQERTSTSMGVAGTATLYVCGELLGFIEDPRVMKARLTLPPAITPVIDRKLANVTSVVDRGRWQVAVKAGNAWCERNCGVEARDPRAGYHQQYYYMYAIERYWAFRELSEGKDVKEPAWYNAGVDYLRKNQAPDGSWEKGEQGPSIDTAFATLFLLRSSKRALTRIVLEQGRLTGGKGLKADMSTASVNSKGQVVTADPTKSVTELLSMLDDPEAPANEYSSGLPDKLVLSADPKQRSLELVRLRRMLVNGSYEARLTSAKTLGTLRDLESVPALIFALSDPDYRVVLAARDSLRFMSRKPAGFGLEITDNTRPEKTEWMKAQQQWTEWLLSVKPDSELIE